MLQLHRSDHSFCPLRCDLYQRFEGNLVGGLAGFEIMFDYLPPHVYIMYIAYVEYEHISTARCIVRNEITVNLNERMASDPESPATRLFVQQYVFRVFASQRAIVAITCHDFINGACVGAQLSYFVWMTDMTVTLQLTWNALVSILIKVVTFFFYTYQCLRNTHGKVLHKDALLPV